MSSLSVATVGSWTHLPTRLYSIALGVTSVAKRVTIVVLIVLSLLVLLRGSINVNIEHRVTKENRSQVHHSTQRVTEGGSLVNTAPPLTQRMAHAGKCAEKSLNLIVPFQAVALNVNATLDITIDAASSRQLSIFADQNILSILRQPVVNHALILKADAPFQTNIPIRYALTVPALQQIHVTGSGKVNINQLSGHSFICTLEGSSQMHVASGELNHQLISMEGSSKYQGAKVTTQTMSVNLHGSAKAVIKTPEQSLAVHLSGSSTCCYQGPVPRLTETVIQGSATLTSEG